MVVVGVEADPLVEVLRALHVRNGDLHELEAHVNGRRLSQHAPTGAARGADACTVFGPGGVAQSVEHLLCKQGVVGSSPIASTEEAARGGPDPRLVSEARDRTARAHLVESQAMPLLARVTRRQGVAGISAAKASTFSCQPSSSGPSMPVT